MNVVISILDLTVLSDELSSVTAVCCQKINPIKSCQLVANSLERGCQKLPT